MQTYIFTIFSQGKYEQFISSAIRTLFKYAKLTDVVRENDKNDFLNQV